MKTSKPYFAKRISLVLLGIIALLAVIHLSLQYINTVHLNETYGPFYELTNRMDFDDESSIPTWFQQFVFLGVAFGAGLVAYMESKKASKRIWSVIAIVALFGSIDEVASIHENILQSLHLLFFHESVPTLLANAWVIIVPFVLAAAILFFYKAYQVLPKRTLVLFMLSIAVFLVGSVFVDILTSSEGSAQNFFDQGIMVAIEEVLELLGLTIAVYATIEFIEINHRSKVKNALAALKK